MTSLILATDDDRLADQCRSALEGTHEIVCVSRGMDVIEAVRTTDPSLVMLDLQIGNMGGIATCLEIRMEEQMRRLKPRPVLLLLDRKADTFLARRSSADSWLIKPIESLRLSRKVAALI